MIDYDYYIENPDKITNDILVAAKQEKQTYLAGLLLRVYHKYLEEQRKKDKRLIT